MYNNVDSVTHNDTAIHLRVEHCIFVIKAKCKRARSLGPRSFGPRVPGPVFISLPWVTVVSGWSRCTMTTNASNYCHFPHSMDTCS